MENVAYIEIQDIDHNGKLKPHVNRGKPLIVMAQGKNCGHCTTAKPAFQELAYNSNNIICGSIQMDGESDDREAGKWVKKWDQSYRGIPTYIGFDKHGNYVKTHTGQRDKESLRQFGNTL